MIVAGSWSEENDGSNEENYVTSRKPILSFYVSWRTI